jgi:hypothetical protein
MSFRDVRAPSERRDVEWLGERTIHRVAGAQHAAVPVLDGSRHPFSLRRRGTGGRDGALEIRAA